MAKETVDDNLEDLYVRMEGALSRLGQIENERPLENDESVTLGAESRNYIPTIRINRDGMNRYQRYALKQKVEGVLNSSQLLGRTPDTVRYVTLLVKLKDGLKTVAESYSPARS